MRVPVLVVGCVALCCGTVLLASGTLAEGMVGASGRYWVGDTARDVGSGTVISSLLILALEIVGLLPALTALVTRVPKRWLDRANGDASPLPA